ncbi:MAG TPA: hypothetical protein VMB23_03850, partial [Spirochaetia bacterium]|nr:hypothetical protein [Spirochaetia bacterium]
MNPMQRASLAALAVVLGACASSPAAGPARTPTTRAALEAASPVTVPDRRGIDSATWTAQPAPVIPASALAGRGAPVPF